ncbi:MAG: TRCF domain-containing protein, partial [Chitinophagaceae bacterium]
DTDLEILIPDAYVESIAERLSLYTRLDNSESEEELHAFHTELQDRFGSMPKQVEDLFTTVRCRKLGVELGFEKMTLKNKTLRCHFINNPDSPYFESDLFQSIMQFVQTGLNKAKLKQTGKLFLLIVEDIKDMEVLHRLLSRMSQSVKEKNSSLAG